MGWLMSIFGHYLPGFILLFVGSASAHAATGGRHGVTLLSTAVGFVTSVAGVIEKFRKSGVTDAVQKTGLIDKIVERFKGKKEDQPPQPPGVPLPYLPLPPPPQPGMYPIGYRFSYQWDDPQNAQWVIVGTLELKLDNRGFA
jgi:hypothetical protein